MSPAKRQASDAMLYTLILFVGLFIASTTVAVIYYIKYEDQREVAESTQSDLREIVKPEELQRIGTIVGAKQVGKSRLATMVEYLDHVVYLIIGGVPENTSAEVKVGTANRNFQDTLTLAQTHIDANSIDPNTTGLVQIVQMLKAELDNTKDTLQVTEETLIGVRNDYNDLRIATSIKEDELEADVNDYARQVDSIKKDYNDLEILLEKTSGEKVQAYMNQLSEERAKYDQEHQDKLQIQAQLEMTQDKMKRQQDELHKIVPLPDSEVVAHKSDGKIILVDNQSRVVHLNIGRDDRVYPGLTFTVYDKNMPIPKDGKGKAEIEVYSVEKNISAARIIKSEIKRPIILDDIIANLIWDSDRTNVFAIEGEFDLNGDGRIEPDAVDKIKSLIEKWGGKVADTISIETDFLLLGSPPSILRRPTVTELEMDPMATERYEASRQKFADHQEIQGKAQALLIPVFNYERFLFFIGYQTQSGRAGAF
jgi:predicted RNA-binding protein with RPS1 domain